jgi:hypothetical protein
MYQRTAMEEKEKFPKTRADIEMFCNKLLAWSPGAV